MVVGSMSGHTPGPISYVCQRCGWSGQVNGKARCLPCAALATRKWRAENPDAARNLKRRMEKTPAGRARMVRHKRERRARNPQTTQMAWRRRIEWLASGDVTREQLAAILHAAQGRCHYCNALVRCVRLNPHDPRGFDHRVPRARGGQHTATNIVLACADCNERKSDVLAA